MVAGQGRAVVGTLTCRPVMPLSSHTTAGAGQRRHAIDEPAPRRQEARDLCRPAPWTLRAADPARLPRFNKSEAWPRARRGAAARRRARDPGTTASAATAAAGPPAPASAAPAAPRRAARGRAAAGRSGAGAREPATGRPRPARRRRRAATAASGRPAAPGPRARRPTGEPPRHRRPPTGAAPPPPTRPRGASTPETGTDAPPRAACCALAELHPGSATRQPCLGPRRRAGPTRSHRRPRASGSPATAGRRAPPDRQVKTASQATARRSVNGPPDPVGAARCWPPSAGHAATSPAPDRDHRQLHRHRPHRGPAAMCTGTGTGAAANWPHHAVQTRQRKGKEGREEGERRRKRRREGVPNPAVRP